MNRKVLHVFLAAIFLCASLAYAEGDIKLPAPNMKGGKPLSESLATVVRGWFDEKALAAAMSLPENKKIILTQTVGFNK